MNAKQTEILEALVEDMRSELEEAQGRVGTIGKDGVEFRAYEVGVVHGLSVASDLVEAALSNSRVEVEIVEPEGVEYTVRDEQGRILEIVTEDGQRIYVAPEKQDGIEAKSEGYPMTKTQMIFWDLRRMADEEQS